MLTYTWKDNYVAEERRADDLARAAAHRELRAIQAKNGQGTGLAAWMVALGAGMQVWGCHLQARYERVLRQQQASAMGTQLSLIGESSVQRNC